jgi:hypothetical protein
LIKLPVDSSLRIDHIGHGVILAARRIRLRSPATGKGNLNIILTGGGVRSSKLSGIYRHQTYAALGSSGRGGSLRRKHVYYVYDGVSLFGYKGTSMEFRAILSLLGLNGRRSRALVGAFRNGEAVRRTVSGGWLYAGLLLHSNGLEFVIAARRRGSFVLVGGLRAVRRGRQRSVRLRSCKLLAEWWRDAMKPHPWENWAKYSTRVKSTITKWGFPQALVDASFQERKDCFAASCPGRCISYGDGAFLFG